MDLFNKIDQFEKLANEIDDDYLSEAETIEEYTANHLERRTATKGRINKLASLVKSK